MLANLENKLLEADFIKFAEAAKIETEDSDASWRNNPAVASELFSSLLSIAVDLKGKFSSVDDFRSHIYNKAYELLLGNPGITIDGTLLSPLSTLSEKKLRLSPLQLTAISESLIPLKFARDPELFTRAYESLALISTYKASPISIAFVKDSFSLRDSIQLEILSFDLLGNSLTVETAVLNTLKRVGKDTVFIQDAELVGNKIDIPLEGLGTGRFTVSFTVNLANKSSPVKINLPFLIIDQIAVANVSVGVSDSKDISSQSLIPVSTPNSCPVNIASAVSLDVYHVRFSVLTSSRKPLQVALKFSQKDSGFSVLIDQRKVSEEMSQFEFQLGLGEETERFKYVSGEYTVAILIGDAFAPSVEWLIGTVKFYFPNKSMSTYPLYTKSLLHSSDTTLKPLQEFDHLMRSPAKRASNVMAFVFTTGIVSLLVLFMGLILRLKPNLQRLSSISSFLAISLYAVLFVLYALYWLGLEGCTFYKTIKFLCFLYPTILFFGQYALRSVTLHRLKSN